MVVCGGMGAECARRATEAVIELYRPEQLISAGFAGALEPGLPVGQVLTPRIVIDAGDGSRTDTGVGEGALVSFASVADRGQKAKLASGLRRAGRGHGGGGRGPGRPGAWFAIFRLQSDLRPERFFLARGGAIRGAKWAVPDLRVCVLPGVAAMALGQGARAGPP